MVDGLSIRIVTVYVAVDSVTGHAMRQNLPMEVHLALVMLVSRVILTHVQHKLLLFILLSLNQLTLAI
jgi:hypothetical protein